MFFACYNPNDDIEVVDKNLKELDVKFDDNKQIEEDCFKTCMNEGDLDGTKDSHLTKEISTVIPEKFEDLFESHHTYSPIEQQHDNV